MLILETGRFLVCKNLLFHSRKIIPERLIDRALELQPRWNILVNRLKLNLDLNLQSKLNLVSGCIAKTAVQNSCPRGYWKKQPRM